VYQVDGITAKISDEYNPTVGLNLLSPILYIKNVSTIANTPIVNLGTENKLSIDAVSELNLRLCG
jgi:hypothetical protein